MKPVIITVALVAAFFMFTFKVEATQCQGRSCDDVQGNECEQGQHRYNPHCSPRPTATASATPTASPSAVPSQSPTPSASIEPSNDPRPSNEPTIRTDLSDGRSDGLGCSVKDCSGNKVAGQSGQILPATGQDTLGWAMIIGGAGLGLGLAIRFFFKIVKEDYKSNIKRFGGDDE